MKKNYIISVFVATMLAFGLSACSTFQRMDDDKVFDDLLTNVASGAVAWVMTTYLTPQAEGVGAEDAIDWLAQQRNRANYHPAGLQVEYRRRSPNPVLEEILVRYQSTIALHDIKPSANSIDSLIKGIRNVINRS